MVAGFVDGGGGGRGGGSPYILLVLCGLVSFDDMPKVFAPVIFDCE